MQESVSEIGKYFEQYGLPLLGALLILVVGWLAAVIASAAVLAILNRTSLDERLSGVATGKEGEKGPPVARWIAGAVKWLILLFTLVMVIEKLGMPAATDPLRQFLGEVMEYLPNMAGAALILFIGWLVAMLVRKLVTGALERVGMDARLKQAAGEEGPDLSVSASVGTAAFWLVMLFALLMVLNTLKLEGLLEPLQSMTTKILEFLPNLLAAAAILAIGWFGATIIRRIVTSLLAAVGVDRVADKSGLSKVGKGTISGLLGTVAFLLVLLPVLTMSLEALNVESVSAPVSGLLDTFFEAIPNLLYAAVILTVAWVIGKLVAGLVADLLARIGFDNILHKLGLQAEAAAETAASRRPSAVAGHLVLLAVLLFAAMEALKQLGLTQVSDLVEKFIGLAGGWLFGLFIFGLGLWLANLVSGIIRDRGTKSSGMLASAAQVGITVLAGIAALNEMKIAEEVVTWTVITMVAAVGLAFGLAFGLGCKEQASSQLDEWRGKIEENLGGGDDAWPS